jgi:hypothetical protein
MVLLAETLGNVVKHVEDMKGVVSCMADKDVIFFISHSETLDPGLVDFILSKKQDVIVFESDPGYKGYSKLKANHPYVRSTFEYNLPVQLSRRWRRINKRFQWYKLAQHPYVAVEEIGAIDSLNVYKDVFGVIPKVWSTQEKIVEILVSMGYVLQAPTKGQLPIGVYLENFPDYDVQAYFNLKFGNLHAKPIVDYVEIGGWFVLVPSIDGKFKVGKITFSIFKNPHYLTIKTREDKIVTIDVAHVKQERIGQYNIKIDSVISQQVGPFDWPVGEWDFEGKKLVGPKKKRVLTGEIPNKDVLGLKRPFDGYNVAWASPQMNAPHGSKVVVGNNGETWGIVPQYNYHFGIPFYGPCNGCPNANCAFVPHSLHLENERRKEEQKKRRNGEN